MRLGFSAAIILTALSFSLAQAQSWTRTTRDIKETTSIFPVGPVVLCSDTSEIPANIRFWRYQQYCIESGETSPVTPNWTPPVQNLISLSNLRIPVTHGGVNRIPNHVYVLEMVAKEFAQWDVVIYNGVPSLTNFLQPPIETWESSGGSTSGGTLSRTVRNFSEVESRHQFYPQF